MSKKNAFYVVNTGIKPGIYGNWKDCESNVKGFKGAIYKKFDNIEEARAFLKQGKRPSGNETPSTTTSIYSNTLSYIPGMEASQGITSSSKRKRQEEAADRAAKYHKNTNSAPTSVPIQKKQNIVYTDGASSNNGKGHARAGFGVYWGENDPRNTSERLKGEKQTNQRAEATAVLHAIEQSQNESDILEIRTDSMYVINGITNWSKTWLQNDWKSSNGSEVKNRDLFEGILNAIDKRKGEVRFTYVPGHQGFEGNEKADDLAVRGAQKDI